MRRRDKLKNIDRANLLAEQRYLKSKGLLKENSVTQALMGAANSGNLGGGIYDIVKNFGKNAVLAALQALMGSGDIDPQGVKNIGLIQTIQKLQENVTEDEGSQGGSTESTNWDEVLTRNLTDPSSDLFTFDFNGKRTTLRVTRVNKISFDNIKFLHIDVQLEPNNIVGDTKTIVVGKNPNEVFLPSKGNTGELELVGNSKSWLSAVRQNMLKQKSQQQDDTINESGIKKSSKRIKITESQRRLLKSKGLITESVEDVMMNLKNQQLLGGYIINIIPSHETLTIEIASEPDQQSGKSINDFDKFQINYFYTDKEWDLSGANTQPSAEDSGLLEKIGNLVSAEKQKEGEYMAKQKQGQGESVNVTEDEGEHERYSQYNIDTNARLKKYASEKEVGTDWSEIRDYFLEQADPNNMKSPKEKYDIYFKLVDEYLTKHGY